MAVAAATGLALAGSCESLWVDELHTSWTLAGSASEISERAHMGNQSPLYFWILWPLVRTLGNVEWVLRLPSMLGWVAAVYLAGRIASRFQGAKAGRAVLAVAAWILLDRIQLFFATEARVYEILQMVNLLGWCVVLRIAQDDDSNSGRLRWPLVWSALSILAIHLHLMGALAVAWQWATLAGWLGFTRKTSGIVRVWLVALIVVLLGVAPITLQAAVVWQRREQWESFAGNAALSTALHLFPILPLLLPIMTARMVEIFSLKKIHLCAAARLDRLVWWVAAAGPWLTAWIVTAVGIAPIMHRRYLLCSALPLVLVTASEWLRIRLTCLRIAAVVTSILWLVLSQGTVQVWTQRQLVGWQRGEDWRSATKWVGSQIESGDQLWCSSGLIEARHVQPPLSQDVDQYLTFPLRGIYRVQHSGKTIEPRALVGNSDLWPLQWQDAFQWRDVANSQPRVLFIVCRARAASIQSRLTEIESQETQYKIAHDHPLMEFGSVCVARITFGRK